MRTRMPSFVLFAGIFMVHNARAAEHPPEDRTQSTTRIVDLARRRPAFNVAYFGEFLLHPGVVVGVEGPIATRPMRPSKLELILAANAGAYDHIRNHTGLFVDGEVGGRLTFGNGVFVDAFLGAGYLHTFLGGPVYTVDDEGRVTKIVDLGRPAFMPTASLGFGLTLPAVAPFLRVETFGQYPFNHSLLPHFALLLGARV